LDVCAHAAVGGWFLCFHEYTRDGASTMRTRPSHAPLIWTKYAPAFAAAEKHSKEHPPSWMDGG
jgi:hypothetical protein